MSYHHHHHGFGQGRRPVNEEAIEALKKIQTLKTILPNKTVVANKFVESSGFMVHSRFNSHTEEVDDEESSAPIQREKAAKAMESDEASIPDAKSVNSIESSHHNSDKNRRYALSLATLAAKSHKRTAIVNEGAIALLIELSGIHDKTIQVRCASAFASLSTESTIRSRMLDEGSLAAIILLATNTNIREIKMDCSRAICNLCCVPGYEFKMVKEGVPFAVMNIAAACPETYDICLKILLNISCVNDKFARIEDVTEALMFFWNINLQYRQEVMLLQTFCNLSSLRNNQLRLVEDGGLRIVEKYYKTKHPELRRMACEMLKNFTIDYRSRSKLIEINVLGTIVEMSSDSDPQIRVLAAKCFLFLSKDRNFRKKIIHSDVFGMILDTCRSQELDAELAGIAAKTLRVLCADLDLAEKLINEGVGMALVSLMEHSQRQIAQFCLEALCQLFQDRDSLKTLIIDGIHHVIVKFAMGTTPEDDKMQEWCAFALYEVTESRICDSNVIEKKVLPCILHLSNDSSPITMSFCAAALASATSLPKVNCSSAIPFLVKMLNRHDCDVNVKKYCATSLFNLAAKDENCEKIFDANALQPVVQLTQSMETKVTCAGIISRLSLHKQYYKQFATGDVLKVLLELSSVDDRLTQRRVVIALSNLSQDEELRQKLLELNPIPYIVSLASERDEYLRRGCISIVCNMSYQSGGEKLMVQAGIIPTLMITSLITTDQFISRIICVKALINLMADRTLYPSIVQDGAIWALSKLGVMDHPELQELCANALCRLSCSFARAMITSAISIRTVLSFLKSDQLHLKRPGTRTLTNLLLATKETDEVFRQIVVENMHPISNSSDEELNELCVICLCLASQSESCRTTIVSSGMLNKIDPSTIFSADSTISYAYITMFANIANDPNMRVQVLDDQVISRLQRISQSKDETLILAALKALYCVSCAKENIPKLVHQNIIGFVQYLFQENTNEAGELTLPAMAKQNLLACLYNLTVVEEVCHALVSAGIVQLLMQLWVDAVKEYKFARLVILAICHLACAKTNSKQMVVDGCTKVLCFITEHRRITAYSQYTFQSDIYVRCSAAFRNLLCVVSNQAQMIQEGCLPVLVQLANQSLHRLAANNNTGNTAGAGSTVLNTNSTASLASANLSSSSSINLGNSSETRLVRVNCAAALKALTFNQELRPVLIESEAINIILTEVKKENDLQISNGLMKELEAESWDNGARGRHKDGRAKSIIPAPIYTDLMKGISNVQLNVAVKDVELSKYYVQAQLDEDNKDNVNAAVANSTAAFMNASIRSSNQPQVMLANAGRNASFHAVLAREGSMSSLGSGEMIPTMHTSSRPGTSDTTGSGGDSPNNVMQSASFRKHKLQKLVTQATLVAMSEEEAHQHTNVATNFNETEPDFRDELTIDKLKPLEDNDEAMGLNSMGYPKQEAEVEVDTLALIRLDAYDSNSSSNLIDMTLQAMAMNSDDHDLDRGGIRTPDKRETMLQRSTSFNSQVINDKSKPPSNSGIRDKGGHPLPPLDSITIPDISQHLNKKRNTLDKPNMVSSNSSTGSNLLFPVINPPRATSAQKASDEEEMLAIVSLIKKAKHFSNTAKKAADTNEKLEDVLDKWKSISRF